jgi:hypothetical protein
MEMQLVWEYETLFCGLTSSSASGSEMESARPASVSAKPRAMDWALIFSLSASGVFALESASVWARRFF